jgi:hypothetical protein
MEYGPLETEYRREIVQLAERTNETLEDIINPASAGIVFANRKERTQWAFAAGTAKWMARALREIDRRNANG